MKGFLTLSSLKFNGRDISTQDAVDRGLVIPGSSPKGWCIEKHEIPFGENLAVDNSRQFLAYLFGNRTPAGSYVCSQFGIGTGTGPSTVSSTNLQSPVAFYNPGTLPLLYTKPVDSIDFPAPYIARVQITLGSTEANGLLITEFGLYAVDMSSAVPTLLCRKVQTPGVSKNSSLSPTFQWRVRF
jgi:hypothetical protein